MRRVLAAAWLLFIVGTVRAETFVVHPYVQHGETGTLGATDSKVLAWVSDNAEAAEFTVEFTPGGEKERIVTPTWRRAQMDLSVELKDTKKYAVPGQDKLPKQADWRFYRAVLSDLPLSSTVHYRVLADGKLVAESDFLTRKPPTGSINFVVFGDSGAGTVEQRKIAYQAARVSPELIMNVGDNVYSYGRASEYLAKFWPVYCNNDVTDLKIGAPLMRSVLYYVAIGNHDVDAPNLDTVQDGLAFYYFFDLPLNGPEKLKNIPPLKGSKERISAFKELTGERFPRLDMYSFDNGPAHFLVLDANRYINNNDPTLLAWIEKDLASAEAMPWKFVFFHQPGFTAAKKHFEEQRMRALTPLFEKHHVDMVFSGHVHNYQRTQPFFFTPRRDDKGNIVVLGDGHIPGDFKIDTEFDGKTDTTPKGIIYIVSGGGGAALHSKESVGDETSTTATAPATEPAKTAKAQRALPPDDISDHMAAYIVEKWSFTRIQLSPAKLELSQIDADGKPLDNVIITK